jgi:chemotaxis protein MotB
MKYLKKNNLSLRLFISFTIVFIFIKPNIIISDPSSEDANDWFYYRSEYRELLKKKRLSEKEFQENKERFLQETSALKRENEILRARLVALEVEVYNTKESKSMLSQVTDRKLSEINERLEQIEDSKEQYEASIQILKMEKEDLLKKLDEKSQRAEERKAAFELIEQLEKEKLALDKKYNEISEELDLLKNPKMSRNENSPEELEKMMLSTNLERMLTPQEIKALKEENHYLQMEIKRLTSDLELVQRSEKDLLSKKLEEQAEQLQAEYNRKLNQLTVQLARLREREQELTFENQKLKEQLEKASSITREELENKLKDEIGNGEMNVTQEGGRVIINLYDKITFDLGNGELKKSGTKVLNKIISALNQYKDRKIYIEGNTDNVPIRGGRYKDNWELSTNRSLSVLRYILTRTNLPEKNFVAVGNGEFNPLKANSSEHNKSINRRVDIVILPNLKTVNMGN